MVLCSLFETSSLTACAGIRTARNRQVRSQDLILSSAIETTSFYIHNAKHFLSCPSTSLLFCAYFQISQPEFQFDSPHPRLKASLAISKKEKTPSSVMIPLPILPVPPKLYNQGLDHLPYACSSFEALCKPASEISTS